MTQTIKPISPLRQRMIDDMGMRKLSDKTQCHYILKHTSRVTGKGCAAISLFASRRTISGKKEAGSRY